MTTDTQRVPKEGEITLELLNCYGDLWHFTSECMGVTLEDDAHFHGRRGAAVHFSPQQMDKLAQAWLRWRMGASPSTQDAE